MASSLSSFLAGARVTPEVFALRPDYRALLIAAEKIVPGPSDGESEALLAAAEAHARQAISTQALNDTPRIKAWRETYTAFGSKPKKYLPSVQALMKRAEAGLPRVNRLTDIYNAVSVLHMIPLGGEDLDGYAASPVLLRASGAEVFRTTAAGQPLEEHPDVGEIVWTDGEDLVTCRRWNWRQCTITALKPDTTRALFILDALDPVTDDELKAAGNELIRHLAAFSPELQSEVLFLKAP